MLTHEVGRYSHLINRNIWSNDMSQISIELILKRKSVALTKTYYLDSSN